MSPVQRAALPMIYPAVATASMIGKQVVQRAYLGDFVHATLKSKEILLFAAPENESDNFQVVSNMKRRSYVARNLVY